MLCSPSGHTANAAPGRHEAKHVLVLGSLRARIEQGLLPPGRALPAERHLATEFGVGRAVIRQAINELETLGLITQEPNCRPVVARRDGSNQKSTKRDQIAVWISPDLQDFGASKMLEGIRTALGSKNHDLVIGCPHSKEPAEVRQAVSQFIRSLMERPMAAGAILWAVGDPALEPTYQKLVDAGVPVVYIDREPPESVRADVVATNHRRAARAAARHLIELGHRTIAIASNDDRASSVRDRITGYREAMAEAGLPWRPELIYEICMESQDRLRADSKAAVEHFTGLELPPTAILAVNDSIAMYLGEAIRHVGLRVPEDISLVGFDWVMRWTPSGGDLTTVAQPFDEIGQIAARCLLERISTRSTPVYRHILLEAPLVVKTSTAASPTSVAGASSKATLGESCAVDTVDSHSLNFSS